MTPIFLAVEPAVRLRLARRWHWLGNPGALHLESHRSGPYTVALLTLGDHTAVGVAKRNPADEDCPRRGYSLALQRAVDGWARAAQRAVVQEEE